VLPFGLDRHRCISGQVNARFGAKASTHSWVEAEQGFRWPNRAEAVTSMGGYGVMSMKLGVA
jgi:hypothetical protein